MKTKDFQTLEELLTALSPYISTRALARICDINEGQMLQYKSGVRKIGSKNIAKINEKLSNFAIELQKVKLLGAWASAIL